MSPDGTYSIGELAGLADVTPRTIRYYVAQGLLASPTGAGGGARYDEDHLRRLRLIRRLQAEHLPLAEIRRRLESMTPEEIESALGRQPEPVPGSALDYVEALLTRDTTKSPAAFAVASHGSLLKRIVAPALVVGSVTPLVPTAHELVEAPPVPDRSQWDRIQLDPNVELHVRRPLSRTQHKQVERLIELARQILKEENP